MPTSMRTSKAEPTSIPAITPGLIEDDPPPVLPGK